MEVLIEKTTKSGKKLYYKVVGVDQVTFFDDINAKLQVNSDCCARTPVRPKDNIDNIIKLE